jgi:hypothetical protein
MSYDYVMKRIFCWFGFHRKKTESDKWVSAFVLVSDSRCSICKQRFRTVFGPGRIIGPTPIDDTIT